jgi:hypothetical protein
LTTPKPKDLPTVMKQLDHVISLTYGPATAAQALGACRDLAEAVKDLARVIEDKAK